MISEQRREEKIKKLTELLIDSGVYNNVIYREDYAYPDAVINENCRQIAEILVNVGYGNIEEAVIKFADNCIAKSIVIDGEARDCEGRFSYPTKDVVVSVSDIRKVLNNFKKELRK